MADARLHGIPATMPGLPTVAETNLRTYIRSRDRRDGIWFLSIGVAFPPMPADRAIGAPYNPATLTVSADLALAGVHAPTLNALGDARRTRAVAAGPRHCRRTTERQPV
ncbi:DUF2071 domain-containing protein [Streptomyces sp. AM6-12]|uniref:DUF2071 domain-containing protein n=1 Tax=Streptomyces sp. AM6-12 TaxID=3345149 RepID=UPI0037898027